MRNIGITVYDKACLDTARVMYLPRRPAGTSVSEYPIYLIAGKLLNFDDVDALEDAGEPKRKSAVGAKRSAYAWKVKNLGKFWGKYALRFNFAQYVEDHWPDARRVDNDLADVIGPCPNSDAHSEETDPLCFYAKDYADGVMGWGKCQHTTCQDTDRTPSFST